MSATSKRGATRGSRGAVAAALGASLAAALLVLDACGGSPHGAASAPPLHVAPPPSGGASAQLDPLVDAGAARSTGAGELADAAPPATFVVPAFAAGEVSQVELAFEAQLPLGPLRERWAATETLTTPSPIAITLAWSSPPRLAGKTFRATDAEVVRVQDARTSTVPAGREERALALAEVRRATAMEHAVAGLDGTSPAPGERAPLLESAIAAAMPRHAEVTAAVTFRAAAPDGGGTFDVHASLTFSVEGAVVNGTLDGPWTLSRDGRTSDLHLRGPLSVLSGALPLAVPGTATLDARVAPR